jgi:hypothetical protein
MEGWIKTYRVLLEWEWHDVPAMMTLWMHLLLLANNKDREWHGTKIRRGQFATSIAQLSSMTGLSVKQIRTCLQRLKNSNQIVTERASKFTIITICKFNTYQPCEQTEGQTEGNEKARKGQAKGKQRASKGQQRENIRMKERKNNIDANASTSGAAAPDPEMSSQESVDFVGLMKFFNRTMEEAGAIIPRCKSCDGKRREFVRARIREHGLDAVYEMITKASQSDFLNGKSRSGWIADFTWLFRPSNFQKVLEGNYDNRTNYNGQQNNQPSTGSNPKNTVTGFKVIKAGG